MRKKGRSGRRPEKLADFLAELRQLENCYQSLRKIAKTPRARKADVNFETGIV